MSVTREKQIYRVTIIGSIVNLLLLVFKFVSGIIGHSSAMIADAVHSLSDFITDIIVILFVRISGKPQDVDHDYGHGKYETLASIIIGVLLIVVGGGILIDGISKTCSYFNGTPLEVPNWWALSAALISIILKEGLFRYTVIFGRRLDSSALIANAWHHRSDAYTSVAALIGIGGAMLLGQRWAVLDPIAAMIVSIFIIRSAWSLMKPGIDELLEKSLPADEKDRISNIIQSTPGVMAMHRLRTRRIGSHRAIEVHIKMPGHITLDSAHDCASLVERRLRDEFGPETHIGIHMEPINPDDNINEHNL